MNQAELKAQQNEGRIVEVTNPFDFDFTHMWGGIPYTLPAGKPMLFPFHLGDHLATHLARQALIRKAPIRDEGQLDGRGKDRPLWSDESIEELKKKIVVEKYSETPVEALSEAEVMRRKIEELNKQFNDLSDRVAGNTAAPVLDPATAPVVDTVVVTDPATAVVPTPGAVTFKDKAEVIAELTKQGIKFDARKGKAELEKLLK